MRSAAYRILDASLNRATEGMRVVEDYTRFVLDDQSLSKLAKTLRHELASAGKRIDLDARHASRDTQGDVGSTVTTTAESHRPDAWAVCIASCERVKQALRSLEEYGKTVDADFAAQVERLRYQFYTLEKSIGTTRSSCERLAGARLYVLVDGQASPVEFSRLAKALVAAGVHVLQLRDKQLDDAELVARARLLVEATAGTLTLAIINDRPDIAAVTHADGVHVGQEEMSVKDARAIVGPQALVGISTHTIEQARVAVLDGANYLGVGPLFPSETKQFDNFPGLDFARNVAEEISLPAFAIGGIDYENLPDVLATGIQRVAVGAAITSASDPAAAAQRLIDLLDAAPRVADAAADARSTA
ncbi:MAG: thiamine phosphate synthase [Planctomycetota bacterium]